MKFIKLTLQDGRNIFVFIDKICDIESNDKGSYVSVVGDYNRSVRESPEEIVQKIEEVSGESELIEGVEVSGNSVFDIPDKLEGYVKDFDIEYKFGGHGFNSFKLTESTQNDVFIRTCYPEILDCIKASFQFMDYYLENGVWK